MPFFTLLFAWLTERKLVAIMLLWTEGTLLLAVVVLDGKVAAAVIQLLSVGVGALGTAIGIMAQSIWKEAHAGIDTKQDEPNPPHPELSPHTGDTPDHAP